VSKVKCQIVQILILNYLGTLVLNWLERTVHNLSIHKNKNKREKRDNFTINFTLCLLFSNKFSYNQLLVIPIYFQQKVQILPFRQMYTIWSKGGNQLQNNKNLSKYLYSNFTIHNCIQVKLHSKVLQKDLKI